MANDIMDYVKKGAVGLVYFALVLAVLWFASAFWPKIDLGTFTAILDNLTNWQMWVALIGSGFVVSIVGEKLSEMIA